MHPKNFVAFILLVIIAFDFKCNGKYLAKNSPDLFPIQKLARISASCQSNQVVSECKDNLEYAVDGDSNTFWRGPSLLNGNEFQGINLTFHFDQAIHIAKLLIDFNGSKHTPPIWSLERSIDHGKTWSVWQYFAKDPDNCHLFTSDAVMCSSSSYNGNQPIAIDLMTMIKPMDSKNGTSEAFDEWTRATSVRFHFYEWKVNLHNRNISENHFYAIKDIEIMGYCEQNGHFNNESTALGYQCEHNTNGICCSQCKPGFTLKEWKPYTIEHPFECKSCDCHMIPSSTGRCEEGSGDCECKPGFGGEKCTSCSRAHTGYPNCKPCDSHGTNFTESFENVCSCKLNFVGDLCDRCICDYIKYPHCSEIDRIRKSVVTLSGNWNTISRPRCYDEMEMSFLHMAARNGQIDLVNELIQFGVPINIGDSLDRTPLFLAAQFGCKDVVFHLLLHGANPNQPNFKGYTPLDYLEDKKSEISRMLQVAMRNGLNGNKKGA